VRLAPLPVYSGKSLVRLEPLELIRLVTGDEDRVPRNVIDECARRGEDMVLALERLCDDDRALTGEESRGEWWLPLHAVHILGLIASEEAGLLLVRFMRRMAQDGDDDLQDWLSGYWPALFRNKPESAVEAVRELCLDRALGWYVRIQGTEVVTAAAYARGGAALEAALDWLAGIAADEQEEFMFRVTIGNALLDFPRARHRALLEELAAKQTGRFKHFSAEDMASAFAKGEDKPGWTRFDDPWKFYLPAQIEHRQERWAKEDAAADAEDAEGEDVFAEEVEEPYVRPMPKVGRNDPCPCGSGKKYKRCCLAARTADEIFGKAALANPRLPELRNTDGDALSFHRILYDIDAPQVAFDALKGLALDATEEELLADAARDPQGALSKVEFGWLKRGNAQHKQWNNTVLGHIAIYGSALTVEVNSRRRADEFRVLAQQLLEGRARYRSTVVESTKAILERSRNKKHDPDEEVRRARMEELKARPEVQALLAQQLEGHYATWPETSLPVLGGKTPLEAVHDADGREMVEALVADIERHLTEQFPGSHDPIVARLRQRLGLAG
jgi:hypothetical protein